MLADALRELAGLRLRDRQGKERVLELLPPATEAQLRRIEAALPCALPGDVRDALGVAAGLATSPLESFSLVDLEGFGLDEVFPSPYSVAHDGSGNYWVLDLLGHSTAWGPVYYACHDPPVIAYQAASVDEFLRDVVAMWQPGARSAVDLVHEEIVHRIWRENPDLVSPAAAARRSDAVLASFAASLPPDALIADLRRPAVGQGFAWGRFGAHTGLRRAGE